MPSRQSLEERVQLLLSWREKASRLIREAAKPIAPNRSLYRAHLRQAEYYLLQTVDEQQGLVEKLGRELQASITEIGRIEQRAAAGRIHQDDANMARLEVERRIERLREEIGFYNRVLRAKRSNETGGFVDLPIDQYAKRLGILPVVRPRAGWQTRHFVGISALVVIATITSYIYYEEAAAPSLACDGSYRAAPNEAVTLTVRNDGNQPLRLRVPWPGPATQESTAEDCGFAVYARTSTRDLFQLVPTAPSEWKRFGEAFVGPEAVSLPPGVEETVELDVRSLRTRVADVTGLRIETSLSDGTILCDQEWDAPPPESAP